MRLVHAHFPINVNVPKDGSYLEVKNYLGGREVHKINMQQGCKVYISESVKDEVIFDGIDNQLLSLTCAQVNQSCKAGKKDNRKFLDGVYVSQRTFQKEE